MAWLRYSISVWQGSVEMQAQSQKTIEVDPAPVLRYIDQSAGMTADEAVTLRAGAQRGLAGEPQRRSRRRKH